MITIRSMCADDLAAVAAIEAECSPFPWPLSQFADSLSAGHRCRVAQAGSALCGFSIFTTAADQASLLNIAVCRSEQGRGIGKNLLLEGLRALTSSDAQRCLLEVRLSNHSAQQLYRSQGFRVVGERKKYYPAAVGREDALVMSRDLSISGE